MLWLRAIHIIFFTSWFAGLFYLPRLFVYHALNTNDETSKLLKVMEKRLFFAIMNPAAVLTLFTGIWMLWDYAWAAFSHSGWLYLKLILVAALLAYHFYCWKWLRLFSRDQNSHSHVFYRWINEIPTVILIAIVILVIVKPF